MITLPMPWATRLGVLLALSTGASFAAGLPKYGITVIPNPPGESSCLVVGLNDAGKVTGRCNATSYVWSAAGGTQVIADPAFPGAQFSSIAINESGTVLGVRYDGQAGRNPSFLWKPADGFTYFGTRDRYNQANGLNDLDQVVGERASRTDTDFVWKAFSWTADDGYHLLRPHADRRTLASGINNHGLAVGSIEKLADGVWRPVAFEPTGGAVWMFPGERRRGHATAVNALGQAVGFRENAQHRFHAFVWKAASGAIEIDPRTQPTDESYAGDLNDAGQVVGKTWHADANGNAKESAFYWDEANGFHDLLGLLDPADPRSGQLAEVYPDAGVRINASGQVTLNAYSTGGESWSLLLTPVAAR